MESTSPHSNYRAEAEELLGKEGLQRFDTLQRLDSEGHVNATTELRDEMQGFKDRLNAASIPWTRL